MHKPFLKNKSLFSCLFGLIGDERNQLICNAANKETVQKCMNYEQTAVGKNVMRQYKYFVHKQTQNRKNNSEINQNEFILFVRSKSLFIAETENNTNSKYSGPTFQHTYRTRMNVDSKTNLPGLFQV